MEVNNVTNSSFKATSSFAGSVSIGNLDLLPFFVFVLIDREVKHDTTES